MTAVAYGIAMPAMRGVLTPAPWLPALAGQAPTLFADFTSEGGANHYYNDGAQYGSFAALLSALGGTFSRGSAATDLLAAAASGVAYNNYANDVARLTASGLLLEGARSNALLNSGAPVTQTVSLGTGTYTLWVNGSGAAVSSANTATGSGFGTASNGSPNTFTLTGAGAVDITVSGALDVCQLENGAYASSYAPATTAIAARSADSLTMPESGFETFYIRFRTPAALANLQSPMGWVGSTANDRIQVYIYSGALNLYAAAGGTAVINKNLGAVAADTDYKLAFALEAGSFRASLNGGAIVSDTPASVPALTTFCLGNDVSYPTLGRQWYGTIQETAKWSSLFASDSALQNLAA